MTRDEMVKDIRMSKQALMFAGPIHYRDLQKHIKRMEAELKRYDRFQKEARKGARADGHRQEANKDPG